VAKRWHTRLGHVNMQVLRRMANQEVVRGLPLIGAVGELCEACMAGKQKRSHFPDRAAWRAERALELIHGDLCDPISPATPSGNVYFLLLVDDHSRYMWVSTLVSKDRATATIKEYQVWVEAESGSYVRPAWPGSRSAPTSLIERLQLASSVRAQRASSGARPWGPLRPDQSGDTQW
jgi:hypothetical protein